jgi:hypothetical protein
MAERLGKVLYWLSCVIAGLTVLIGILIYASEGYARKDGLIVTGLVLAVAIAIWLIGPAFRDVRSSFINRHSSAVHRRPLSALN